MSLQTNAHVQVLSPHTGPPSTKNNNEYNESRKTN